MIRRKARGSVELRGDHWFLRIRATGNGATSRRRIPLGHATEIRSEVAARRVADAWLARRHPEQLSTGDQVLAGDYFERFLRLHVALLRKSSQKHHRAVIREHLMPRWASTPLHAIGTAELQALIADLTAQGLARATILAVRTKILHILSHARLNGFDAQVIAAKLVRVPKQDVAERERRNISPDELERILTASEHPWRALWAVMGYLGLRVSEALALTWRHLDIESVEPLASIRQSTSDGEIFPLKTKTSRADLPIPDELVAILADYKAVWQPNAAGLLFATRSGAPQRAEDVRREQLLPLLKRLQLPHAGFHAFRHGLPRRLFEAGNSASVVQQLMRHGSLQMTERYTHTKASDLRAAQRAASEKRKTLQPCPNLPQASPEVLQK